MFPVYCGKCLSIKRFTTRLRIFLKNIRKSQMMPRPGADVAQTTVQILLCCGFRRTGKGMGQVYQSWWRICRQINDFSRFEYHMFYFLHPFVTYSLTRPRICLFNNQTQTIAALLYFRWEWGPTYLLSRYRAPISPQSHKHTYAIITPCLYCSIPVLSLRLTNFDVCLWPFTLINI
jgi:hypothetical protein